MFNWIFFLFNSQPLWETLNGGTPQHSRDTPASWTSWSRGARWTNLAWGSDLCGEAPHWQAGTLIHDSVEQDPNDRLTVRSWCSAAIFPHCVSSHHTEPVEAALTWMETCNGQCRCTTTLTTHLHGPPKVIRCEPRNDFSYVAQETTNRPLPMASAWHLRT